MAHTIMVCGSIAFSMRTPREIVGVLALPERCRSAGVMRGVLRAGFKPRGFQHIGRPHAGSFGATRAAIGPLVAARRRREGRAAVAAAFKHHALRHGFVVFLQLGERDLERLVHLAVDRRSSRRRDFSPLREFVRCCGCRTFPSAWCRRRAGFRGSPPPGDAPQHHQPFVLAGEFQELRAFGGRGGGSRALRVCCRDEPAGSIRERHCTPDRRAHCGQSRTAQKSTPARRYSIGPRRVIAIQVFRRAFGFPRHRVSSRTIWNQRAFLPD